MNMEFNSEITIPINEITNDITVTVNLTGCKTWKLRRYIGVKLMKAGIVVLGMNAKIEE